MAINTEMTIYYQGLRQKAILYSPQFRIFELAGEDSTLDFISQLVTGRSFLLEPNKVLHTLILNEEGKIIDVVYVMMFEDKYWLLSSYENNFSRQLILEKGAAFGVEEITDQFKILSIEGPYSWKILKHLIGLEILGLSYLRFMDGMVGNVELVVCRSGITGEFGYRLFVPIDRLNEVIQEIATFDEFPVVEAKEADPVFRQCLLTTVAEVRFPVFDITVFSGDSPIEHDLRWMIDFRKEEYIGKEAIEIEKGAYTGSIVGFICQAPLTETEVEFIKANGKISIEDQEIGRIELLAYSPKLEKYIGYGRIDKDWAYAGVSEYQIITPKQALPISTASTPFFITESSNVQME